MTTVTALTHAPSTRQEVSVRLGVLERRVATGTAAGADWVELAHLVTGRSGVYVWVPKRPLDSWTERLAGQVAAAGQWDPQLAAALDMLADQPDPEPDHTPHRTVRLHAVR